jgi:hypothetical protein
MPSYWQQVVSGKAHISTGSNTGGWCWSAKPQPSCSSSSSHPQGLSCIIDSHQSDNQISGCCICSTETEPLCRCPCRQIEVVYCGFACQLAGWEGHQKVCGLRQLTTLTESTFYRREICCMCRTQSAAMLRCPCHQHNIFYCGPVCQQAGWEQHKGVCGWRQLIKIEKKFNSLNSKFERLTRKFDRPKRPKRPKQPHHGSPQLVNQTDSGSSSDSSQGGPPRAGRPSGSMPGLMRAQPPGSDDSSDGGPPTLGDGTDSSDSSQSYCPNKGPGLVPAMTDSDHHESDS